LYEKDNNFLMMSFPQELRLRNPALFWFGLICLGMALVFLVLTRASSTQVNNISAWWKPFKFALSIAVYSWTMGWLCHYLPHFRVSLFNTAVIVLLGFEIVYIALQAGRGQLSHFNVSTPLYTTLYGLMGLAAVAVTIYTAYVGVLFFRGHFPGLPEAYLWGIRLGIVIFVIFSFEGGLMGGRMTHTIGGADGGPGLPLVNWSTQYGDPRIAHFIGMHALQLLPLLSFYVLHSNAAVFIVSGLYLMLAVFTLVQALKGRPLVQIGPNDKAMRYHRVESDRAT
jgi:hypothetical protein